MRLALPIVVFVFPSGSQRDGREKAAERKPQSSIRLLFRMLYDYSGFGNQDFGVDRVLTNSGFVLTSRLVRDDEARA